MPKVLVPKVLVPKVLVPKVLVPKVLVPKVRSEFTLSVIEGNGPISNPATVFLRKSACPLGDALRRSPQDCLLQKRLPRPEKNVGTMNLLVVKSYKIYLNRCLLLSNY